MSRHAARTKPTTRASRTQLLPLRSALSLAHRAEQGHDILWATKRLTTRACLRERSHTPGATCGHSDLLFNMRLVIRSFAAVPHHAPRYQSLADDWVVYENSGKVALPVERGSSTHE